MRVISVLTLLIGLVVGSVSISRDRISDRELSWKKTSTSTALLNHGKVVWQFNHGPGHPKPCFHPLATLDGTVLTGFRPSDHRWHRAGWFSFKFIDGVNYWEENKRGVAAGITETVDVKVKQNADFSAVIDLTLSYHPPGDGEVLAERRRIQIGAPDRAGDYTMDWQLLFTARRQLELNRTPLPGQPGGKAYGGYAGLSLRLAKQQGSWKFLDSEARTDDSHAKRARWLSFSGPLPGGHAGLTFFDHPSNPSFPTQWYMAPGMPYFSPAFLFDGPMQLVPGQHLSLFYRLRVHGGRTTAAALESDYRDFAQSSFELIDPDAPTGRIDLVKLGRQLCSANCIACHAIDKQAEAGKLGPHLYGLLGKSVRHRNVQVRSSVDSLDPGDIESVLCDEVYVQTAITNPSHHLAVRNAGAQAGEPYPPAMPPFRHFNAQQVQALIAFLKTRNDAGESGPSEVWAYEQLEPPQPYGRFEVVIRDQPKVYRVAMANVSTRAICVGLPGGFNYIFDPATFSVRRAWGGGFLDLKVERSGRGKGYNRPSPRDHRPIPFAECLLPLGPSGPIDQEFKDYVNNKRWRRQKAAAEAHIITPFVDRRVRDGAQFGGYLLVGNEPPTFLFTIDGTEYTQQLVFESDHLLHFQFTTKGAHRPVRFKILEDKLRDVRSTAGTIRDGILSIPTAEAGAFTISLMLDENQVQADPNTPEHPAVAGKTNLALRAKASSKGTRDHAALGPHGAVDGRVDTFWDETDSQESYLLQLELVKPSTVSAATILGYRHHDFAPRDFELILDGKSVKQVKGAVYVDNLLLVRFPPTECSKVELKVTGYYGGSPAIRELGLFHLEAKK